MTEFTVISGLVVAIAVVLYFKARQTIRREAGAPRGLAPGTGDHIIEVEYSSGLGGGHATQIRVPKDPQAYARRFVPLGARRSEASGAEGPIPRTGPTHGPSRGPAESVGGGRGGARRAETPPSDPGPGPGRAATTETRGGSAPPKRKVEDT